MYYVIEESEVKKVSDIGNKGIFARNLSFYIERSGKTQREIADVLGVATSTLNNWVKGQKYPRMDKVEMLANYFGILKSDLIEEKLTVEKEKDNDIMADIIVRMRTDDGFFELVKSLNELDSTKIEGFRQMLSAFQK